MEETENDVPFDALFGDICFAFPEITQGAISKKGLYNPLLDAIMVRASPDELLTTERIGHEVAHRLFAIDGTSLRLARKVAGVVYSFIWYFVGNVARYEVDLTGTRAANIKVHGGKAISQSVEDIQYILGQIQDFDYMLSKCIESTRVMYELAALELGIRLVQEGHDASSLEVIKDMHLDQQAEASARDLYSVYPTYWVWKEHLEKGTSHEDLHVEIAKLRHEIIGPDNPGYFRYFEPHKKRYEDLFRELFENYKNALSAKSLREIVLQTNWGIRSPLSVNRDEEGAIHIYVGFPHSTQDWAIGRGGPQEWISVTDEWRVAQLIDFTTMNIPEYYRFPVYVMNMLDILLFKGCHPESCVKVALPKSGI